MNQENDTPRLTFFRQTPDGLIARPPLTSSLQSFESSLFLVALGRYPHAFTSCAFALESAIKAAYNLPSSGGAPLKKLLEDARRDVPALAAVPQQRVDDLRETRNRIVHYGFSPKDDAASAGLLLDVAVPMLTDAYRGFFNFDLVDSLIVELGAQLRLALNAYGKVKGDATLDPTGCFAIVAHQIRWMVRESLMSSWEGLAATHADEHGARFEYVAGRKARLELLLGPEWVFDCPICDTVDTMVCQLDGSQLEARRIALLRAVCADCDLVIPEGMSALATAACADQIEAKREAILRDYGHGRSGV